MLLLIPVLQVWLDAEWQKNLPAGIVGVADLYTPCLCLPFVSVYRVFESDAADQTKVSVVVDWGIENVQ